MSDDKAKPNDTNEVTSGRTSGPSPASSSGSTKIPLTKRPLRRLGGGGPKNLIDYAPHDVYVAPKTRRTPIWFGPLLIVVGVFLLILVLPKGLNRVPVVTNAPDAVASPHEPTSLAVVTLSTADVLEAPSVRAKRITQALYNEPVTLIDTSSPTHVKVRLSDGIEGYIARDALSAETRSVLPTKSMMKVIVRSPFKAIMSAASRGAHVADAPMGSVLYADYSSDQVMRVMLPTGGYGWITKDDVFVVNALAQVPKPSPFLPSFTSSAMAFYQARWMPGGMTQNGIAPEGIVRVAGLLNGLSLPRTADALLHVGTKVTLPFDAKTKMYDLRYVREGDVVVLAKPDNAKAIDTIALCMPGRMWLTVTPSEVSIQLIAIADQPERATRVMAVIRLVN